MAKQIINEAQLTQLVKEATAEALNRIFEGAGWDTMKRSFKTGLKGTKFSRMNNNGTTDSNIAKDYIKNGDNANWEDFNDDRKYYNRARNVHNSKKQSLKNKMKNPESYTMANMDNAHEQEVSANRRRNTAASNMINTRPGLIGKAQRAGNVGAYRAGKALKGVKDKAVNFVHDKIGLEEE